MSKLPDDAAFCEHCHQAPIVHSAPHRLSAGTILHGKYLIGDVIGEGGFGITYIGIDITLELKVAVKEFYPHGYANRNSSVTNDVTLVNTKELAYFDNAKERFLAEAKSIAKFSDESAIVDVRDYFTENNTAYIVMEYIDGITLAEHIKKNGVFGADDLFYRMTPLMQALERMHRQSVIHRDISPDNIMIDSDGAFKLMDFGSARYFAGENKRTMSVILKPGYAPFEQYSTEGNQGPWTDVYGLSATIYKCITGVTPPDALSRCQQDKLQPPSSLGVAITSAQENAIMRGLRVYPNDRLQSVGEMFSLLSGNAAKAAPFVAAGMNTMLADDRFDEMSTRRSYRDGYSRMSMSQNMLPKKNHVGVIVAVIIIITLLIIGSVVTFLIMRNNTKSAEPSTDQSVTESDKVTVPDVSGKKLSDAQAELEALGLSVETTFETSDTIAKDYVIRQSVEAERSLSIGDTVMLYVSKGVEETDAPAEVKKPDSAPEKSVDVDGEVEKIRTQYYATQSNPGDEYEIDGVTYYYRNGNVTKAVCPSGFNEWNYTRWYFYSDGELYFAFVFSGSEEHRLYFADGTLIRYIDSNGTTMNYGSISCPFESQVKNEAYSLSGLNGPPKSNSYSVPYLVRIFPVTKVYDAPSNDAGVAMTLDEENVYTIVEERVADGNRWGRLKSGAGWLNLDAVFRNGGYMEKE